ncbi:MAG: ArnT family glycosyltransferase, partial [Gammaproteobacteria bacterium]
MHTGYRNLFIALTLTLIAALPRFYELGSLSFYGDEETTAFPARSLAEDQGPRMPSGMPYHRALPHTWLNALCARFFGIDSAFSYRVSAAVLGTLTVPLLFLLAGAFFGWQIALIAALLLAVSEWHIITSREARMYAPFLFLYVATGFALWRWAVTAYWPYLVAATVLFCLTVATHTLGIFVVLFALTPIAIAGWAQVRAWRLIAFALSAGAAAHLYSQRFVLGEYDRWRAAASGVIQTENGSGSDAVASLPTLLLSDASPALLIGASIGAALGAWAGWLNRSTNGEPDTLLRVAGQLTLAVCGTALLCTGRWYGAALVLLLWLLMLPLGGQTAIARSRGTTIAALAIAAVWTMVSIGQLGLSAAIKVLFGFPYPYLAFLASMFPAIMALFAAATLWLALRRPASLESPLRACVFTVILPIVAVGVVSKWGGVRYVIQIYPFLLLVSAFALLGIVRAVGQRTRLWQERTSVAAAAAIAVSGVLGGHGIPQAVAAATLTHGDKVSQLSFGYPFYPDHQGPGEFVRQRLVDGDIVVAEDALQQRWYVGKVDYWLRDPVNSRQFLYRSPAGYLRDIYVSSTALTPELMD